VQALHNEGARDQPGRHSPAAPCKTNRDSGGTTPTNTILAIIILPSSFVPLWPKCYPPPSSGCRWCGIT
jgi:hypothetical protein